MTIIYNTIKKTVKNLFDFPKTIVPFYKFIEVIYFFWNSGYNFIIIEFSFPFFIAVYDCIIK